MKKLSFVFAALVLLAVGCASEPEVVPEPVPEPAAVPEPEPQPEPEPEPTSTLETAPKEIPAPEAERAEATRLRETIQAYELERLAESDYDAAEVEYKKGEELYGTDNAGSKTAFDASIAGYQGVIGATFPGLARRSGEQTEGVRTEAQRLKAEVAVPGDYAAAEEAYQKALAQEKAGDYGSAIDEYKKALTLYEAVYATTAEKKDRADQALSEADAGISAAEQRAAELEAAEKTGGAE